jgi:hypothetical protein
MTARPVQAQAAKGKSAGASGLGPIPRRNFLRLAAMGVLGSPFFWAETPHEATLESSNIPGHLPKRLAICYYGWQWITTALAEEPFGNLTQALKETRERGFNCVRAEMGLNWMFDLTGSRRGKLKFTNWIPGFSSNLHCVDGKGGGEYDIFERVTQLFEIAAKNDIYIILTSWEYQDAISQLDEPQIRRELLAVPYNDRLMLLARQYDRLLGQLKKRGLHKYIAQVELVNELNQPPIFCAGQGGTSQTAEEWTSGKGPQPPCTTETVRQLAFDAIDYLQHKHPDLLITVDGLVACTGFRTLYPQNAQVADHHVYCNGVTQAFWEKCGITAFSPGESPDPLKNRFLAEFLKPNNTVGWSEFVRQAGRVRRVWWAIGWLYVNLDNEKFDRWCIEHFPDYERQIKQSIDEQFACAKRFAMARNLPLVVDEGFVLYPPLHSRFIATPEGHKGEEMGVDAAIATHHWGVMPTGYFRPDTPQWKDDMQCNWIRKVNQKILASI